MDIFFYCRFILQCAYINIRSSRCSSAKKSMKNAIASTETDASASISLCERVAYGLGNTASCIVYTLITSLLAFFYTDYIGISAGAVGTILITSCTLPLVKQFGDNQRAWIITISLFMLLGMLCLLLCFLGTKERVQITADEKSDIPFRKSLRALFYNKYWAISMGLWGMQGVYLTFNGTNLPYYCEYILGNKVLSSGLSTAENLVQVAVIFTMPLFLRRFGKRNMALSGAAVTIIGQIPLILFPTNFSAAMVSAILRGVGAAPMFAAIFSFIADSVEYGQWKTHLRIEGMIFSAAFT